MAVGNQFTEVCQLRALTVLYPKMLVTAEPFEDEIHPRLRFPHRGIVAMANNGSKNSNDSQFFITLGTSAACVSV